MYRKKEEEHRFIIFFAFVDSVASFVDGVSLEARREKIPPSEEVFRYGKRFDRESNSDRDLPVTSASHRLTFFERMWRSDLCRGRWYHVWISPARSSLRNIRRSLAHQDRSVSASFIFLRISIKVCRIPYY